MEAGVRMSGTWLCPVAGGWCPAGGCRPGQRLCIRTEPSLRPHSPERLPVGTLSSVSVEGKGAVVG